MLLGINGAQGTGKSTLAEFLAMACSTMFDWNVATLSIDDFYYTKAQRADLARTVHPLLQIRGVPGTHDTQMLSECIEQISNRKPADVNLPRFDKSTDDRANRATWPGLSTPIDLIVLEGWCVGSTHQTDAQLKVPVNQLEREEDPDGTWRHYANNQLKEHYEPIWSQMDLLVFLQAPSFEAILAWRLLQEEKLASRTNHHAPGLMSRAQIQRFIQFYERLTRANLQTLPAKADFVFVFDETHNIIEART